MTFNQNKYTNVFKKENYDRISLVFPKGTKVKIKEIADKKGVSVNALIVSAIEEETGLQMKNTK